MNNTRVQKLTLSAVMIALSAVLSLVTIFHMPLGGSVTLFSMLPVCLLSIMFGCRWGFLCAFAYSLTQLALGIGEVAGWGLTPAVLTGCILFDYLLAFTAMGFAGIFRKHGAPGYIAGIALAVFLRLVSHFISGTIFFASLAPEEWNPVLYSLAYNSAYMLPEFAFTVLGTIFLLKEPHAAKLFRVHPDGRQEKPGV